MVEMVENELFLLANEAAEILGCDPQSLRSQAQSDPRKLGFNVVVIGNRVKIPRKPFFDYLGVKGDC